MTLPEDNSACLKSSPSLVAAVERSERAVAFDPTLKPYFPFIYKRFANI